ncbi:abnormal spindle-like microcephaly-associated protein homolog [Poecilia reticulata]|uniref:abnormal spindle-like microcephaly-associated protein homolog n=1 Tax=Poecilia reticulata TaxID=8081 RepID=UPI0004A36E9E|nr:PREDICTED: abnormal spindle-like microcephaly-associated protein homolog [Poecilia reticulata]
MRLIYLSQLRWIREVGSNLICVSPQYHLTIQAVSSVENSLETLLDLLQKYREKAGDKVAEKGGSIFTKACFLLALLLQDERHAQEVVKLPKVLDRIGSIYRLTARKHRMDKERSITRQRINGSFYVPPTLRKSKPPPKPSGAYKATRHTCVLNDPFRQRTQLQAPTETPLVENEH